MIQAWRIRRAVLGTSGVVAAVLGLTGCSAITAPQRVATATVAELEARVLDLQRRAAVSEVEIATLRERVAELERAPATTRAQRPPSPPGAALPPPVAPKRQTPPPVPLAQIEESEIVEPVYRPGAVVPAAPGAVGTVVSSAAQGVYDQAYTLFHQGRYAEAETTFKRFLDGNRATDLADNAQFWIGESRFQQGDHRGALDAYRETVRAFPSGNKVPDALLKQGQCFELLGDSTAARRVYAELIASHPTSAASAVAAERQRRLAQ